jgi:hypothetical protein
MTDGGLYYKHSGKFSLGGAIYALVVGSAIMCFCAFVYAYIILYSPLVYINLLVTLGFGAIVGYACATLLKRKKVRSDAVAVGIAFLVTSVAYYYSWVAWIWALLRRNEGEIPGFADFIFLLFQPWLVWNMLGEINAQGVWTIGRSGKDPVSGIALTLVWLVEAAIIYGLALFASYNAMDEEPFCETCEEWGKKKERVVEAVATDLAAYRQRIEAKDFKYLEAAGAPTADHLEFQRIDVFSCEKCGVFHTLDSTQVKVKIESGKRKEETKQTVHHLILTAGEADALRKLGEKMHPVVPPTDAAQAAGAAS